MPIGLRPPLRIRRRFVVAVAGLLFAGCHDAPRDNPMDPELTPAVGLQVALDDSAGTAHLTWTPYAGSQPFTEYRVLRHEVGRASVDTLAVLTELDQTTFIDTFLAPNTSYAYRISVLNAGGYQALSGEHEIDGYKAGPVVLLGWQVAPGDGAVELRWRRYTGARFASYRIQRRRANQLDFSPIAQTTAIGDTAYTDGDLEADVDYFYQVAVRAADTLWTSNTSGRVRYGLESVVLAPATEDGRLGAVALRWSPYGGPHFEAYRIMRRVAGSDQEQLLGELLDAAQTEFADGTAVADVNYVYTVVVAASDQELTSNQREARLVLPAVQMEEPLFDSSSASAELGWTPYTGPRFSAYRVQRRTAELAWQAIVEVSDSTTTSFTDSGLQGNTEYFYRVTVVTAREEAAASGEVSGAFHELLATWPLEFETNPDVPISVRLRAEPGNQIAALVYRNTYPEEAHLMVFDQNGRVLEESQGYIWIRTSMSAAACRGSRGQRFLGVSDKPGAAVMVWDPVEGPQVTDYELFADAFSDPFTGEVATILGEMAILGSHGGFTALTASADGAPLALAVPAPESGWEILADASGNEPGFGPGYMWAGTGIEARRSDLAWSDLNDLSVEVDTRASGGVRIGGSTYTQFTLRLERGQAIFAWVFTPPEGSALPPQEQSHARQLTVVDLPHRISLRALGGRVTASVQGPPMVIQTGARERFVDWASLCPVGDIIAFTAYDQAYNLDEDEVPVAFDGGPIPSYGIERHRFDAGVTEIAAWQSQGQQHMAVCMPEIRQILTGTVPAGEEADWPSALTERIGPTIADEEGLFSYPLSLDGSPDGRLFVLDAAKRRIVVFEDGVFLTQWGNRGSGPGEFDFGEGDRRPGWGGDENSLDFEGSIAVDDEGYVYVADGPNRRIQKFSP